MAETVLPSVRGRERLLVGLVLVGAGTAAGALAGLVLAILLAPLAAIGPWSTTAPTATVATIVAAGVALDAIRLLAGRPAPPTVGRQVPAEWARWFPARTTAALYGARLGVGPLTILSTWTWWSTTVAAGLLGPATGAATGATFGLIKLGAVAGVSQVAGPTGHSEVFGRLRRGNRPSWAALTGASAIGVVLTLATAGCGGPSGDADEAVAPTTTRPASTDLDRLDRDHRPTAGTGRGRPTVDRPRRTGGRRAHQYPRARPTAEPRARSRSHPDPGRGPPGPVGRRADRRHPRLPADRRARRRPRPRPGGPRPTSNPTRPRRSPCSRPGASGVAGSGPSATPTTTSPSSRSTSSGMPPRPSSTSRTD